MGEKYKDRILIDMGEFQSKILEHVCSEEFNKQFDSTQFSTYEDAKGYRQAMMHGMVMASIMTSQCEYLCVREKVEKEEQGIVEEIKLTDSVKTNKKKIEGRYIDLYCK